MSYDNYYISSYYAIKYRDAKKYAKLSLFSEGEKKIHPEEFPGVSYNDIYQDRDPEKLLEELINSHENDELRFLMYLISENISLDAYNNFYNNIISAPLLPVCFDMANNQTSLFEYFISKTYSRNVTSYAVASSLKGVFTDEILYNILKATTTCESVEKNPLRILISNENLLLGDVGGMYIPGLNILFLEEDLPLNFAVHELTHKLMDDLFDNDSAPYGKNDNELQVIYHRAIRETLKNIYEYFKIHFSREININLNSSTSKIAEELAFLLFPANVSEDNLEELLEFLENNGLSLYQKYEWLNSSSYMEEILSSADRKQIKMKELGYVTPPHFLSSFSFVSSEYVSTFLLNNSDYDLNFRNAEGDSAIDAQGLSEVRDLLIIAGAEVYPQKNIGTCSLNPFYSKPTLQNSEHMSTIYSFSYLLISYVQDYDIDDEDDEFIVRYPQIIAEGNYKGDVVKILEPIANFWDNHIYPRMLPCLGEDNDMCENIVDSYF